MLLSFLCAVSTALSLHPIAAQERKPPKRPETPFTVFVDADPRGEPDIEEKILRARDEFKESVDRRDEWFLRLEDRDYAEIIVELKALFVEDENRSDLRTSVMGTMRHTSEYLVDGQRYTFYAVVTLLGNVVELKGSGERKEADAASTVVKELDRYVKKNYWQLLERRELWHASRTPPEELGREWIGQEIARRVEALGARVDSAEWRGETLVVTMSSDEFHFPFSADGFEDCVRTMECQHLMVRQIMEHLEKALGKN